MTRKEERQNMTKSEVRDMVEPYKPLYTAKQAAQILLINVSTVYELMNTGQLPYLILGTATLLSDVRNYLDITFEDEETDRKLSGIIERGVDYLDKMAGAEQDYEIEALPKSLLLDYCRYARNNVLELFEQNFRSELLSLRIGVQTDDYAKECDI